MLFNSFVLGGKKIAWVFESFSFWNWEKGTLRYFSLTSDRLHNKRNLQFSQNWVWQNHQRHQETQSLDLRVRDQILMFYLLQSRICHPKIISITFSLPHVYLEFILNWLYLVFNLERKKSIYCHSQAKRTNYRPDILQYYSFPQNIFVWLFTILAEINIFNYLSLANTSNWIQTRVLES